MALLVRRSLDSSLLILNKVWKMNGFVFKEGYQSLTREMKKCPTRPSKYVTNKRRAL
jgi:hypothetical protein